MTEEGKQLIRQFEGCSLVAYKCPAGVWTVGFGQTHYADGTKVKEGDKIDMATANAMFDEVLKQYEQQVLLLIGETLKTTLPKISIDALVSFAYNCGTGAFAKSTLLKKIKADKNNLPEIEKEFMKWNKSAGKELKGLTRRRKAEFELYKEGILSQYSKKEIYEMYKCNYK